MAGLLPHVEWLICNQGSALQNTLDSQARTLFVRDIAGVLDDAAPSERKQAVQAGLAEA